MFEANPNEPTMTISIGFEISISTSYDNFQNKEEQEQSIRTWRAEEALNSFHEDREAKGQQEYTVDKRSQYLRPMPTIRVSSVVALFFPSSKLQGC